MFSVATAVRCACAVLAGIGIGVDGASADTLPTLHLAGTAMRANAGRSLALIAVGQSGWGIFRAGDAVAAGWSVASVRVDEVILQSADGAHAVVSMRRANEPTGLDAHRPSALPAVGPSASAQPLRPAVPQAAVRPRALPAAASIQAAQQEFDLPPND